MTKAARTALEIAAVAAVLALAAALVLPVGGRPPTETGAPRPAPAAARRPAPAAEMPQPAPPEQIAGLFGWRAPGPQPAPPPPAPPAASPPVAADWLAYVGFVADADGERFLFKDRRTGKVIPISAGSADWRLVEERPGELIAEHDGRRYLLKRGK